MSELKLDFGCGPNKKEGFLGVDSIAFQGVDWVLDVTKDPWPWAMESVDEVNASHFMEHLTAMQRIDFMNKLYRIMKVDAKFTMVVPHWASCRAYGDPTHQWPPISEFWFFYLDKKWRMGNAPHTDSDHVPWGYNCHFESTWGYGLREDLMVRNQEYQMFAVANYKEVCQDTIATIVKRAMPVAP